MLGATEEQFSANGSAQLCLARDTVRAIEHTRWIGVLSSNMKLQYAVYSAAGSRPTSYASGPKAKFGRNMKFGMFCTENLNYGRSIYFSVQVVLLHLL